MPYKNKSDQQAWFQKNKERVYARRRLYPKQAYNQSYQKAYREEHKVELALYISNWQKENPEKLKAIKAKRRSSKLNRTPAWLSTEESKAMSQFYLDCPVGYEVDHIIPLQGKTVSGLHVLANLQYLTVSQNRAKGNRF